MTSFVGKSRKVYLSDPFNFSGLQAGFYFQTGNLSTILSSGTTKETFATFEELEAKKAYSVKVFIVTSGGWNEEKYLLIDAITKAAGKHATFSSKQINSSLLTKTNSIGLQLRLFRCQQNTLVEVFDLQFLYQSSV